MLCWFLPYINMEGRFLTSETPAKFFVFLFFFSVNLYLKAHDVNLFLNYVLNIDLLVKVAFAKFLLNYPFSFCNKFLL